jgi:hypothetical protein
MLKKLRDLSALGGEKLFTTVQTTKPLTAETAGSAEKCREKNLFCSFSAILARSAVKGFFPTNKPQNLSPRSAQGARRSAGKNLFCSFSAILGALGGEKLFAVKSSNHRKPKFCHYSVTCP